MSNPTGPESSDKNPSSLEITSNTTSAKPAATPSLSAAKEKEFELYKTLARNIPNTAVLLFDRDLRFTLVEGPALGQHGFSKEYLEGKTLWEAYPPEVCQEVAPFYLGALEGTSSSWESQYEDRVYYLQALPIRDDQDGSFTGMVMSQDITARKKIERLKDEFISTVSHELRTPLTSIQGALGLLVGGLAGDLPEKAQGILTIANRNSERLLSLINNLLDIEKITSNKLELKPEIVTLWPLLEQAVEANQGYASRLDVKISLAPASHPSLERAKTSLDVNCLMQIMANLLSNAVKFTFPGDTVVVLLARRGSNLRVAVTDHGSGIPPEFYSRIFQKFAQADASDTRRKGGTGLGLSITKALVEKMGGEINFESVPDQETTFYFDLPEWYE